MRTVFQWMYLLYIIRILLFRVFVTDLYLEFFTHTHTPPMHIIIIYI